MSNPYNNLDTRLIELVLKYDDHHILILAQLVLYRDCCKDYSSLSSLFHCFSASITASDNSSASFAKCIPKLL